LCNLINVELPPSTGEHGCELRWLELLPALSLPHFRNRTSGFFWIEVEMFGDLRVTKILDLLQSLFMQK
jgi:hypothetical protein